jgi:GH43 family beta-xylosidase
MSGTYSNPVYPHACPDPFVLKYCGEYWAYCTGFWHDGRCFGVLHSPDLVHWRDVGGAMEPLPGGATCYWAPEVTYDNGKFLLYYSVGNEENMQIRVAVAAEPAGPFVDSGRRLSTEEFAIDAHVFEDDDGQRYLFYATDFLEHTHIGTGTAVDRMPDPLFVAGEPRPVTRARYEWQVYDPNRASKGHVRWHTVEGPFVLKRRGVYYQMFSGGNWQNLTYGVAYATSRDIHAEGEWHQHVDGERVLPILRTIPGLVVGPGHNSVVRGPDNLQLYCVYHRWAEDNSDRVLAIDRQDWVGERMTVLGPSTTPQPAPNPASVAGFGGSGAESNGSVGWAFDGDWVLEDSRSIRAPERGAAMARCVAGADTFVCEVSGRAAEGSAPQGTFGVAVVGPDGGQVRVLVGAAGEATVSSREGSRWREHREPLRQGFDPTAFHLFRVEANGRLITISLDNAGLRWRGLAAGPVDGIELISDGAGAEFAGFELTVGWEDLFDTGRSLEDIGWRADSGRWRVAAGALVAEAGPARALKGSAFDGVELVVNARALDGDASYGVVFAAPPGETASTIAIERVSGRWMVVRRGADAALELPADFDPGEVQQFRFRKRGGRVAVQHEAVLLGEFRVTDEPAITGIVGQTGAVEFDSVRAARLPVRTS